MVRKIWNGKTGVVNCFGRCTIKYDEVVKYLQGEHFVEHDASRTHSGTERYWIFDVDGVALAFRYHDITEELYVGANKDIDNPDMLTKTFLPAIFSKEVGEMWK